MISYGGSLSGEHGDGQSRGALLPKMFGDELMGAFREFKAIWDPDDKLNPHKVVNAYQPTENLRLGADYAPRRPQTHFTFPDDGGSIERASLRCVGLGECRKHDTGSMCPSYMVTLEEQHSTRGRAHMLFELLQGEVIRDGWQDEHVKESLDLCLSCKACKSECPANVDMATYRAEFLSHYYEGHRRPIHAYTFGLIRSVAAMGSRGPLTGERGHPDAWSVARTESRSSGCTGASASPACRIDVPAVGHEIWLAHGWRLSWAREHGRRRPGRGRPVG